MAEQERYIRLDRELTISFSVELDEGTYAGLFWGCPREHVALDDLPVVEDDDG